MSRGTKKRATGAEAEAGEQGAEVVQFGRWHAGRKRDVVLRLLRGESLDGVSREIGVDISTLEKWRDQGLAGLESGLRARRDTGAQRELDEALQRLGELSMENELLRRRCGLARPSPSRRSKP